MQRFLLRLPLKAFCWIFCCAKHRVIQFWNLALLQQLRASLHSLVSLGIPYISKVQMFFSQLCCQFNISLRVICATNLFGTWSCMGETLFTVTVRSYIKLNLLCAGMAERSSENWSRTRKNLSAVNLTFSPCKIARLSSWCTQREKKWHFSALINQLD